MITHSIEAALQQHREHETYRELKVATALLDFSSNDYLGLARSERLRAQLIEALHEGCPLGSTGSRLLSGQNSYFERVESFLSEVFAVPSALIFSSGFMANLGVFSTFGTLEAHFFSDEKNHASLVDGMRLSKCQKSIFRHNDVDHLKSLLGNSTSQLKVIATESVFSMDGDLSPLRELLDLAAQHEAWLVVDEAHATGVFGSRGLGRIEDLKTSYPKLVSVHTGGKALGGQGAFVLSARPFRELMINRARSFIFSTALSPLHTLQIELALREVMRQPQVGRDLLMRIQRWQGALAKQMKLTLTSSQILPLIMGSNQHVLAAAQALQARGFDVRAIRYPTVAKGSERLRFAFKSDHTDEQLYSLAQALLEVNT